VISKLELHNWKIHSLYVLLMTEIQDASFREMVCKKCTPGMRLKRKCEEEIPNRTFCEKLVKTREKNKVLQQMELKVTFESPLIRNSHFFRKIAESIYGLDKG
jgi:hypothetical protein